MKTPHREDGEHFEYTPSTSINTTITILGEVGNSLIQLLAGRVNQPGLLIVYIYLRSSLIYKLYRNLALFSET